MSPPSRLVWVNMLRSDLQQVHCGIDSTERQVVIVQRKEHQTSRVTTAWGRRAGWKSFVVGSEERRRCDWFLESQRGLPPTTTCTLSWVKYGYLNVVLSRCSQNLQKPTKKPSPVQEARSRLRSRDLPQLTSWKVWPGVYYDTQMFQTTPSTVEILLFQGFSTFSEDQLPK